MRRDSRPATSGYARIAQAEEEEEEEAPYSDHEDPFTDHRATLSTPGTEYAPIQPRQRRERMHPPNSSGATSPRRPRRRRTNSGVDIKAINLRLERWAEEIKERFQKIGRKGKSAEDEHLEIYSTVFQPPDGVRPATKEELESPAYDDTKERMSKLEFDDLIESVRTAIEMDVHPKLISQGSSGSYFARNSRGKTVGVFKPKDEEPYASKNPKWTKWIHRNLFPFAFGRAMLIPNLSYVSEAAAYVLDCQLRTNLVPYTEVVGLSSKSFHYDYFERRAFYRKHKPFPEKLGSFQVFLKGYQGATEFFKEHPWPDRAQSGFFVPQARSKSRRRKKRRWADNCRPGSAPADEEEEDEEYEESSGRSGSQSRARQEFWTEPLQQSFREELEKLVILDYVMRNTDRGTDNWMIRIDKVKQEAQLIVEPPKQDGDTESSNGDSEGYARRNETMNATSSSWAYDDEEEKTVARIGAIDNSLSWPWKHPDAWRSYPFGWLFLPVSLIGRPFSERTRKHFLPLLTSKDWWKDTRFRLRACFEQDADFQERMFRRQMAVMKGQAWNVVETLKSEGHGPLELCRRGRVLVWDDVVEVPVAVPLTRPSEEMRRQASQLQLQQTQQRPNGIREEAEEEMDISSAAADANGDLLGLSTPTTRDQNPFNISRQNSNQDIHRPSAQQQQRNAALSPPPGFSHSLPTRQPQTQKELPYASPRSSRPAHQRSCTQAHAGRISHDIPRPSPAERQPRRFSFSFRRLSGVDVDTPLDEEDQGDLGFAATSGQEGRGWRRRVIVERVEVVKGREPVFSWC
jgi:phosphatidylinositol 4-kinase type 2